MLVFDEQWNMLSKQQKYGPLSYKNMFWHLKVTARGTTKLIFFSEYLRDESYNFSSKHRSVYLAATNTTACCDSIY